jgi:membrane protease YdiL (CAAX protease family)
VGSLATLVALFPSLFAAGWVFAQVAMHTGRIGPAIVSHAVFNGVPAIALVVAAAG